MKRKVIALTGGIGSGKSTVAKLLAQRGYTVLDCDQISREVAQDKKVLQKVVELLGNESVVDGKLNRKFVREKIFGNDLLYTTYSNLFWAEIAHRLQEKVEVTGVTVFVEIPVIDAFPFPWTEVWLIEADQSLAFSRAALRDGVSVQDIENVAARQNSCKTFTKTICNSGNLEDLAAAVEAALKDSGLL